MNVSSVAYPHGSELPTRVLIPLDAHRCCMFLCMPICDGPCHRRVTNNIVPVTGGRTGFLPGRVAGPVNSVLRSLCLLRPPLCLLPPPTLSVRPGRSFILLRRSRCCSYCAPLVASARVSVSDGAQRPCRDSPLRPLSSSPAHHCLLDSERHPQSSSTK